MLRDKWFRTLVRNLSDIVALLDADGIVRFINAQVETILGFRREDVLGHNVFEFVHPEDVPRTSAEYAQTVQQEGEGVPSVLRLRDVRGAWIPFEIIANNQLKDPDIQGVIFTARDVRYREEVGEAIRSANVDMKEPVEARTTELARRNAALRIENQARLRTEQQLQNAISLLNATLDATADGILVVSTEGKVSSCNARFLNMWGFQAAAIGKADAELLSLALPQIESSEEFLKKVKELYARREATSFDVVRLKDGRVFERYSQPQRINGRVVGRVWSFRDVTQARRLEQDLRQSQKMEAVGRLAGGLAHDFNNLLMLMSGYLDQLIKDPSLAPQQKTICEQILATTRRGASLTRQLLTFSRKDQSAPRVADLNGIVLDMEGMLRRLLSDVVHLQISVSAEPLYIFLDVQQMELVILNLALNGQDAMPGGGTLSIKTLSEAPVPGDTAQKAPKSYALLQVTDTGHGMTPEVQAHIFEPFFTTKDPGKGTGLGLATVSGIVHRAEGQIKITSQPDQGTTFFVYLPRTTVAPPGAMTALPVELPPERGHETILLAEDEAGIRAMTGAYLESLGYHVLEAANGTDAINVSREYNGEIDMVLTDVLMPGMRGDLVVREIRKSRPKIQALFMTGYASGPVTNGALETMEKPFAFPDLGRRIRMLLDRRRAGDTSSAA